MYVFKLLSMNTVYPVADIKLSDKHGNILPDVYLMESGSSEDLAKTIHTELAKESIRNRCT